MSELNSTGQEVFDQTPTFCPIKFDRPIPLHLRIRDQILQINEDMRNQSEFDTPEEADDFEIDGEEWNSPYEVDFDHIHEMKSDASKEDSAPAESSGGAPQAERSDASSSDSVTASPSE